MRQKIDKWVEWVLIGQMTFLLLTVTWQIASRYVLNSPSEYTDELAGYLLIWMGLLGAAYLTGKRGHLAIDFFVQKTSAKSQQKLQILVRLMIALFGFTVLIIGGTLLTLSRFNLEVVSAALEISLGYIYLIIPLSGILICFYALNDVFIMKNQKAL